MQKMPKSHSKPAKPLRVPSSFGAVLVPSSFGAVLELGVAGSL